MGYATVAAAATHAGRVRELNEDAHLDGPRVYAVADGMGGHEAGEVASQLVVQALRDLASVGPITAESLRGALELANARIRQEAERRNLHGGMGTTAVGVVLDDPPLAFNIGDSRLYRWRDGRLTQLSVDHSVVQELVDAGSISPEEARSHPQRSVITRAVGVFPDVPVDVWALDAALGDRYLMCSDGLTGEVDVDQLPALVSRPDLHEAAAALVTAALDGGGRDNVTVVLVDVRMVSPLAGEPDDDTNPRSEGDTTRRREGSAATVAELIDEVPRAPEVSDDGGAVP